MHWPADESSVEGCVAKALLALDGKERSRYTECRDCLQSALRAAASTDFCTYVAPLVDQQLRCMTAAPLNERLTHKCVTAVSDMKITSRLCIDAVLQTRTKAYAVAIQKKIAWMSKSMRPDSQCWWLSAQKRSSNKRKRGTASPKRLTALAPSTCCLQQAVFGIAASLTTADVPVDDTTASQFIQHVMPVCIVRTSRLSSWCVDADWRQLMLRSTADERMTVISALLGLIVSGMPPSTLLELQSQVEIPASSMHAKRHFDAWFQHRAVQRIPCTSSGTLLLEALAAPEMCQSTALAHIPATLASIRRVFGMLADPWKHSLAVAVEARAHGRAGAKVSADWKVVLDR